MAMGLMKPFLTTKMRLRVKVLSSRDVETKRTGKDPLQRLADDLGVECIPVTFGRVGAGKAIVPNEKIVSEEVVAEMEREIAVSNSLLLPQPPSPLPLPPPAE
jgi:hypothetical protein